MQPSRWERRSPGPMEQEGKGQMHRGVETEDRGNTGYLKKQGIQGVEG